MVCVGPGPKTLETGILKRGDLDIVCAKRQSYCHSYNLWIDGNYEKSSRNPVFAVERGFLDEHDVAITANRDLEDLYDIVEAGRKYEIHNYVLTLTDSHNTLLPNSYKILILAYGSLDVLNRISPEKYEKAVNVLEGRKNSKLDNLWPLACVFIA